MNNEPVAWRTHYPSGWEYKDGNPPFELKGNSQLLYINPIKEPTDEEILHQNLIWGQQNGEDYSMLTVEDIEPLISLIRAILRKESERWTKNEYEPPDFFFMENDLMGKR